MKCTLTHYGWIGLCPIYMSDPFKPDSNFGVTLEPRIPLTGWFIDVNAAIYNFVAYCMGMDMAGFPIRVSGELDEPIVFECEEPSSED